MYESSKIVSNAGVSSIQAFANIAGWQRFADFGEDLDQRLSILRILFDGYGCRRCSQPNEIERLVQESSATVVRLIDTDQLNSPEASRILADYSFIVRERTCEGALGDHRLI